MNSDIILIIKPISLSCTPRTEALNEIKMNTKKEEKKREMNMIRKRSVRYFNFGDYLTPSGTTLKGGSS